MDKYRLDIHKLGWMLLPPILRGGVIQAILRVLLDPLVWVYNEFGLLRGRSHERLVASGQSLALVEALRRAYGLHEGDIYIVDGEDRQVYLYSTTEGQQARALYRSSEDAPSHLLTYSDEGSIEPDFYVFLPDFLSSEPEVLRLIEQYRPAGRRYAIKYYTYG